MTILLYKCRSTINGQEGVVFGGGKSKGWLDIIMQK